MSSFFFFNAPAPTELSPLPLHDALPISKISAACLRGSSSYMEISCKITPRSFARSEEHTSELQSQVHLLCPPFFFLMLRPPPSSPPFPSTTLFRSQKSPRPASEGHPRTWKSPAKSRRVLLQDRKSTRLNSSHRSISYVLLFFF